MNDKETILLAKINYTINVYLENGQKILKIFNEFFQEYTFAKGDKEKAFEFIKEVAKICGIEVELKS